MREYDIPERNLSRRSMSLVFSSVFKKNTSDVIAKDNQDNIGANEPYRCCVCGPETSLLRHSLTYK